MSDIRLEREFGVSPARLFEVISSNAGLLEWWGHDGWTMRDEQLDFTREGPWHAAMLSDEGNLYKLSGQVTKVEPIETIGFTWGWHDPDDNRGAESHVTFTVQEMATGSKLVINHRELPSDDIAAQHERGWGGPLGRLERLLGA
ncbi:SRPBCC family protein [Sulfitobacter aestuariivivens]|uniref:SRPBCC domain-containing protein n=1 Tax=Sulfitobacter aestuariivivens TaxID=2766981 RepID=A0A927D6E6_9RHOB|nr:SRPBCC domain-containing protein [Sulfitobacter aestuariivivens]MBD3665068.1 SRPBCC domain-containing protein [Sulfitobacter aestuariivivens]